MAKNPTIIKIMKRWLPLFFFRLFRWPVRRKQSNPYPVFLCVLKTGFSLPHSLSSYPLMSSALPDASHFPQLSHHSFHQPQKSDSSLVGSNAAWDMDSMVQPIIGFAGAPGYQSGNSHSGTSLLFCSSVTRSHTVERMNTQSQWFLISVLMPCLFALSGVDLIEEHLHEIRTLRQRLEDSIRTNERLRQQLETRLAKATRDGGERREELYSA